MRIRVASALVSTVLAAGAFAGSAAIAQSSASTYSYGTYNPVQAAINRNTMNAMIIRQATGGTTKARAAHSQRKTTARRRR